MTTQISNSDGIPVELNVYDLMHPDNPEAVPTINWYLYGLGMGLYHSGVSIYNKEYCYGGHQYEYTGVFSVTPKKAPDARFRQTILIGRTSLTQEQVDDVIDAMSQIWTGNSYNLLTRNCNHFASDLCERLTGTPAPEWVNRLAWVGQRAKFLLPDGFDTPMAAPVQAPQSIPNDVNRRLDSDSSSQHSRTPHESDDDFLDSNNNHDPDHD